jgi:hypothetical protein
MRDGLILPFSEEAARDGAASDTTVSNRVAGGVLQLFRDFMKH